MNSIELYNSLNGEIQIKVKFEKDTVWLTLNQMGELFGRDKSVISRHLKSIFSTGELVKNSVVAKNATTASDGKTYQVDYYNLDVIISIGYRVNSKKGTQFRIWATNRLREYLIKGYALNQKRLEETKVRFLKTLEDLKILTENNSLIEAKDVLSLVQSFSHTWFSLDKYDKNEFPKNGTKEEVRVSSKELQRDLQNLKLELIKKGEATELFGQEKRVGNLEGIFGNVFQSVFGQDAYPSIEEKAAHLLYFIVKNHPFNDGNKRSGAFGFVWLLQKARYGFIEKISPETLTALTILIAESNPGDKEKMIGIVLLLLNTENG